MTRLKSQIAIAAVTSVATTALLCMGFLIAVTLGATTTQSNDLSHSRFDLTESSNSDHFYMKGTWVCYLEGTFGGASVTLVKLKGSVLSPVTKSVNVSVLVGATIDVNFTVAQYGVGNFRWEVIGGTGTTIEADCADAN